MKNILTQGKASKSASKRFERPEEREKNRDAALQRWAAGIYDGVRVGQCEWYSYTKRDGRVIKLQGTWELAYAKWLDESGTAFESHRGKLQYFDDSGVKRSYHPDFRMADGSYVDVKNPYYEKLHARKLELVSEQNQVVIKVINKSEMERLGLL